MKKLKILLLAAIVALTCLSLCACTTDSPVVGTYKLVEVSMDNGTKQAVYPKDNPSVDGDSFVLELKDNYKWTMNIMLPGLTEHEDGKWVEDDGVYSLHEDKDDPKIILNFDGNTVTFKMSEDGYLLNVTLVKQP